MNPVSIKSAIASPDPDMATMHDLYARQTAPWVVAVSFASRTPETAGVCVIPSDVKEGNQVSQVQWPLESSTNDLIDTGNRPSDASRGCAIRRILCVARDMYDHHDTALVRIF